MGHTMMAPSARVVVASVIGALLLVVCIVSVLHDGNTSPSDSRTAPLPVTDAFTNMDASYPATHMDASPDVGILTDTTAAQQCPFGYDAKESAPATCPFLPEPVAISPSQEMTSKGCECASTCGPSAPDFKCDWCYTKEECGNMGLTGHWDYCVYPAEVLWGAQDHATKSNQLWAKITAPDVVGKSAPVIGLVDTVKDILTESMITTFDDHWSVFPTGRKKVIHVQGVNCAFRLNITSKGYTGIFEEGQTTGVIRMGSATSLDNIGLFSGFGIKWLRSGLGSADFVALSTAGPGTGWNYFKAPLGNHVAPAKALQETGKFQQASGCIDMVGLSDVCSWTQEGEKVTKPVFPFEIIFDPAEISFSDVKKSNEDLLGELASIPVGSKIWNVYTYASPKDRIAGNKKFLGEMTTIEQCHPSLFGDEHMFFRHQRMEEDFALVPEWIPQMAGLKDTACVASAKPISNWQCVPVPGPNAGYQI